MAQISMPSARFEPDIPASEWPYTHALDRAKASPYMTITVAVTKNEND